MAVAPTELLHEDAFGLVEQFEREISKVIVGQEWLIKGLLLGLFADIPYSFGGGEDGQGRGGCGHLLLEGVPGVAKTLAVVTLARTIQAPFQRIQLTPDLLPADLVGTRIYDLQAGDFKVQKGPIFSNIVLADEINRATPKTQSALLEAMQERQVTIGDETFRLDDPFWVLATQNPIEQEGVYLLPEAQVDRFAMMIRVDYPTHAEERAMLDIDLIGAGVSPVITPHAGGLRRRQGQGVRRPDRARHPRPQSVWTPSPEAVHQCRRVAPVIPALAGAVADQGVSQRTGLRNARRREAAGPGCAPAPTGAHGARRG